MYGFSSGIDARSSAHQEALAEKPPIRRCWKSQLQICICHIGLLAKHLASPAAGYWNPGLGGIPDAELIVASRVPRRSYKRVTEVAYLRTLLTAPARFWTRLSDWLQL